MKVYVGMPCGETIMTRTAACLMGLVSSPPHIGAMALQMDTYCDRNHNLLVQGMLELPQMDALLFVDSDQEFPIDALDRLVDRKVDIVGAAYRCRQPPHIMMPPGDGVGLKEVDWIPSGLMLVRRHVFEKIGFPWFPNITGKAPEEFVGSDVVFCRKARLHGFKIWCDYDLSREVTHLATIPLTYEGGHAVDGRELHQEA